MNSDGIAGASGQTHGFNRTASGGSQLLPSPALAVKDCPALQTYSKHGTENAALLEFGRL